MRRHMGRGIWKNASGRRHLGGGIWVEASGRMHLGEGIWGRHLRGGIWEEASGRRKHLVRGVLVWEGPGVALGRLWEASGRSFGGSGSSGGSRSVWDGLSS